MITVRLVGGLGNQLFGYFLGRYLELEKGVSVRFDLSEQLNGLSAHKVSITELGLPGQFGHFVDRHIRFVPTKFLNTRRAFRKISRTWQTLNPNRKYYFSSEIGFDSKLNDLTLKNQVISGYFQCENYFDLVVERIPELKQLSIKDLDSWSYTLREEIIKKKPIALHVRRGDYVPLAQQYGLLGEDYYTAGIDKIYADLGLMSGTEIWVFSDSPDQIAKSMPKLMAYSPRIIETPSHVSDTEVLVIMSNSDKLILANSTFSWWAAKLNIDKEIVVAPNKWHKSMDTPKGFVSTSWEQIESKWL